MTGTKCSIYQNNRFYFLQRLLHNGSQAHLSLTYLSLRARDTSLVVQICEADWTWSLLYGRGFGRISNFSCLIASTVSAAECGRTLSRSKRTLCVPCSVHHIALTFSCNFQMFLMPSGHKQEKDHSSDTDSSQQCLLCSYFRSVSIVAPLQAKLLYCLMHLRSLTLWLLTATVVVVPHR